MFTYGYENAVIEQAWEWANSEQGKYEMSQAFEEEWPTDEELEEQHKWFEEEYGKRA